MADDGHEEQAVAVAPPPPAELPEIKLFGRWSCDDVQISDMSLQVSCVDMKKVYCRILSLLLGSTSNR